MAWFRKSVVILPKQVLKIQHRLTIRPWHSKIKSAPTEGAIDLNAPPDRGLK
ncbi:MAG: hypothetical protein PWR01_4735, partial [Clostridiales bacterium]|nr:hypothetical protein [Clostridiales bacterium]MDN5283662.1 hypothetical protein [Candidatus Ozemobacter sp.]